MADNKNAKGVSFTTTKSTRIEIETDRRGLSSDEIQELSKREMQDVTGGFDGEWRYIPVRRFALFIEE